MKPTSNRRYAGATAQLQPLESRCLCAYGTTTSIAVVPSQSFGLDLVVKTTVKQTKGSFTPHGAVELLSNNEKTNFTGRVDHLGRYTFRFTAGDAFPVSTQSLSVRYLGSTGKFIGSKSKASSLAITTPTGFVTQSDGLQIKTLVAGSGTRSVVSGDTAFFEDTGYDQDGNIIAESFIHGNGITSIVVNATPDQTIRGVDESLIGMKVGETRVAYVPSALAYDDGKNYLFVFKLDSIS